MQVGQETYCPLCGAKNLAETVRNGTRWAYCGADFQHAHTAFAVGVEKPPEQPRPAKGKGEEE